MTSKKTKGFTLIELMVVIAIIGLLSSIILATLSGAKKKADEAVVLNDIHQLKNGIEMYYATYNKYPAEDMIISFGGIFSDVVNYYADSGTNKFSTFMSKIPKLPQSFQAENWDDENYMYMTKGFLSRLHDQGRGIYCGGVQKTEYVLYLGNPSTESSLYLSHKDFFDSQPDFSLVDEDGTTSGSPSLICYGE